MIYSYDGIKNRAYIKNNPPYEWKIEKPGRITKGYKGKHRIGVHIYTNTGKSAYDEMDFFVYNILNKHQT